MGKDTKILMGLAASLVIGILLVFVAIEVVAGPIFAKSEMILNFIENFNVSILFIDVVFLGIDAFFLWVFWSNIAEDEQRQNLNQTQDFKIPPYELY